MEEKYINKSEISQKDDNDTVSQVYVFENDEKDRKIWDIRMTDEYDQFHLIRIEIDRSVYSKEAKRKNNLIKITDIDLWMKGNKHSVI